MGVWRVRLGRFSGWDLVSRNSRPETLPRAQGMRECKECTLSYSINEDPTHWGDRDQQRGCDTIASPNPGAFPRILAPLLSFGFDILSR